MRKNVGALVPVRFVRAWMSGVLIGVCVLPGPAAAQFADSISVRPLADGLFLLEGALDQIIASVGPDGTLLVDAGYPDTEPMVRDALARIGADDPSMLVNTHWHHTFANAAFGEDAVIVAHRSVLERSRRANPMFGQLVPPVPPAGRPDIVFQDSLTISYNGEDIRLFHLGSAHTDGDIAVYFPAANVVATGDVVVPHMPWTDLDQLGRFDTLLASVDRLLEVLPRDAILVPGHGEPMDYELLGEYATMLRETADTVRARVARGWTLDRVQHEGPPPGWDDWEGGVPVDLFLASAYRAYGPESEAPPPVTRFIDGRWWVNGEFRRGDWYSVGARFTRDAPGQVDRVVDLEGRWVVPPLAEAHTHWFGALDRIEGDLQTFTGSGIFYGMVQDPAHQVTPELRGWTEGPATPDMVYTQGVVTPSWGVMADFYTMMAGAGAYGEGVGVDDLEGEVVFFIDDEADLEAKWPMLSGLNDDFIKVILAFSEEHEARRAAPDRYDAQPPRYSRKPGLTPSLLRPLVARAHADGLRVSAHIETAADFRLAVDAGVDVIAHLPASWQVGELTGMPAGDLSPWLLEERDAARAAARGTVVVTTASPPPDKTDETAFAPIHRHNLELLRRHGVRVAVGSDQFQGTVVDELIFLDSLGVWEREELLRIAVEDTPGVIFPRRRLGRIAEHYEASFVVLEEDPRGGFHVFRDPAMVVKQGRVVQSTPSSPR